MEINKPVVTYVANDFVLPQSLKTTIVNDLPAEGIEWQRSYGRPSKTVYIEAQLVPYNDEHLARLKDASASKKDLLHLPLLHTFWIEFGGENDTYKNTTKEELAAWINKLRENAINEWLVVVLEPSDGKKANKTKLLPRTSAVDKVKGDFPPGIKGAADHCVALPDPSYTAGKPTDAYQTFLARLRNWLLASYSKHLTAYEDFIRLERERRIAIDWTFFDFFFLQEELAFAFETMSLYDEALVQYDELDALFSQFVINSNIGEIPSWLQKLSDDCDVWHGLYLSNANSAELRKKLKGPKRSLLDLRNYLFARQCELLLLHNKPWEVASRSLPFLQNCVYELRILEIDLPEGAVACWVFLSALEILQKCERYSDSSQMETYSRHTVELWAYSRKKLEELGIICGLMPGMQHTSECLHRIVSLIGGIGDDPYADQVPPSPQARLKEALSTPDAYLKNYLEISELTMGTYKHIGRLRFARLIGLELASLYMKMNKHQQAIPFLIDLEKVYLTEKWTSLLTDVRKLIYECYDIIDDKKKKLRYACLLAASSVANERTRKAYLASARLVQQEIVQHKETLTIRMEEVFPVISASLPERKAPIVTRSPIELQIVIKSNLPEPIECREISVSFKVETKSSPRGKTNLDRRDSAGCAHGLQGRALAPALSNDPYHPPLRAEPELRTYHSAAGVGVKCPNIGRCLKRSDSHGLFHLDRDPQKDETGSQFVANNITIEPGLNEFTLEFEPLQPVTYVLHQVFVNWTPGISFLTTSLTKHTCFSAITEEPSLKIVRLTTLTETSFEILSGMPQSIVLQLNAGTRHFPKGSVLAVKSSRDLVLKLETEVETTLKDEISLPLPVTLKPFENFTMPLIVKGRLANQRDASASEHHITLSYKHSDEATSKSVTTSFHLVPPFMTTIKLHTCYKRKFAEILVHGVTKHRFEISKAELKLLEPLNAGVEVKEIASNSSLVVCKDQTAHLVWEIHSENDTAASRLGFSMSYDALDDASMVLSYHPEFYECDFKLTKYSTLYSVRANVEPQKGLEFCRVGSICNFQVAIERVDSSDVPDKSSVMYEVIGDAQMWNVTGRTAGVLDAVAASKSNLTFEVLPLMSGFLPLPTVRLSKYMTLDKTNVAPLAPGAGGVPSLPKTDGVPAPGSAPGEAKLVAFDLGQIYNWSRAAQVHVLPSSGLIHVEQ